MPVDDIGDLSGLRGTDEDVLDVQVRMPQAGLSEREIELQKARKKTEVPPYSLRLLLSGRLVDVRAS